jgi:stearoyl-CoA desaturase (delta-9 desaturase)
MNISWTPLGGILDFSFGGLVLWTLIVTQITIQMVTIYLHRTVAHVSLYLHPIVAHFFRFWNWLATGMTTKEWAAIHRKHHAKVDTKEDPHSPITKGKLRITLVGVLEYVKESYNSETIEKHGHNTPNDWIERNLYTPHNFLGVGVLLGVINVLLFGLPGLIVWGIQAVWIPFWAAGVINGAGHFLGYQNYKRGDGRYPNVAYSTNISPIGFWIGGEELHNNHHAFPTSAFFAKKWYEFDIGSVFIRILCLFRLARLRIPLVPKNSLQMMYYRIFNLG